MNHFKMVAVLATTSLLLLMAAPEATAQRNKRNKKQTPDAITLKNLQKHIGILAADSLEGRRTGTPGEQKAIAYIQSVYTGLGIAAAGPYGNYFQPFEVDEGKALGQTTLRINGKTLIPGTDFFPMVWSPNGPLSSNNAPALNEQGTAWWHDVKEDLETNAGNPHFALEDHLKSLVKSAATKGATACVFYNSSKLPDSLAFNKKDRSTVVELPTVFISQQAFSALGISPSNPVQINGTVALQATSRTGYNVVAFIDNKAEKTIILGAHLDHLGYGEDENSRNTGGPAIHNGADDNASGTAALLELARILKAQNFTGANLLFVHFSGEELGLYGSKYFADHATQPLDKAVAMINMDMVGRLTDSTHVLTIGGVGTSPAWPALLNQNAHPEFLIKIDSSGTGPSDHTSFYRKNIPVLFFFTGLHTDYHKPSDDAGLINYVGEVSIVNYIVSIVNGIPAKQNDLVFAKTKEQSMGTGRFKVSIGIMPDYTFAGQGVRADGVIDGRPAQKAGLQTGDIIIQLGEHLVTSVDTYMQALNRFEKGQSTTVLVKRNADLKEMKITF